jgi:hypothetical protein
MLLQDVDIPQAIIDARKQGRLVLFAGAGVSLDAPSNYPTFLKLAREIGGTAYPKPDNEPVDRYLGRLQQQGLAVHERVRQRLSLPDSRPNHLHKSIVRLFGSSESIRIVTTNFDDHFRGAATEVFGHAPEIYRAPALPLGDDFKGIIHLHGSVRDDERTLVLTDADFGRAYLTQGWARRFVQRLFAEFLVLFVGYSHQDLPLLYLARGISAASPGPGRYALTSQASDTDWRNLGITPVPYVTRTPPLVEHGALGECLARWAEIANLGSLGMEEEIRRIVTSDRPETPEEFDLLKQALRETRTLVYFTRHAQQHRWLEWISDTPEFKGIFAPEAALSEASRVLANWYAQTFAVDHYGVALELVRRAGQTLSPELWYAVVSTFHQRGTAGEPLRFWAPVLVNSIPSNGNSDSLAYLLGKCAIPDDQQTVLLLFRRLTAPVLRLRRRFSIGDDKKADVPDAEVVPIGNDHWVTHAYQTQLLPHLHVLARGLAIIVTSTFEEARSLLLMYGKAGPKWDPISFSRGSTASRIQDHLRNGFSTLIDAGVDVLRWANENERDLASALISQWIESSAPILRRLAITGMTHSPSLMHEEKLSWGIAHNLIEDFQLKNETFALLAEVYAPSSRGVRAKFLAQAEATYKPESEDHDRYELFNLLSWLQSHAPECDLVAQRLKQIHERQPQWKIREHPDFASWIGGGVRQLVPDSPVAASQIEEMNLEALQAEYTRLSTLTDPFGDSSEEGFLQEIARTAAGNFPWSMAIAEEAMAKPEPTIGIWPALLLGLSSAHQPEEWTALLAMLARLEPIYGSVLHELASLLKSSVDRRDGSLPLGLLNEALAIANAAWSVCSASEAPMPEESDDWVTVAINRTSGYLLDFYFGALRLLWQTRQQEQPLIQSILRALVDTIEGASPASEVARILVAANAPLFAGLDPGWYEAHVLSSLALPASPRSGEQCWDGYLVWGSWSQEMLPGLLPVYLSHLPSVITASSERSRMYCDHLAAIAVFGSVDPIENGWLDTFLITSRLRERLSWAGGVTQVLREANQQAKDSAWNRWLHRYLERRVQSNPIRLEAPESGAMSEWALVLESHYTTILDLLLAGPSPCVKGDMSYYRLHEAGVLDQAPVTTARFLTALLSEEDGNGIRDWDQIHTMIARLIELNPAEPALRSLCEELGRLGSPRAIEFRNRLAEPTDEQQ